LSPDEQGGQARRGGRPLHDVGADHAEGRPPPATMPPGQGILRHDREVRAGYQDEHEGKRQELAVSRPRHRTNGTSRRRTVPRSTCMSTSVGFLAISLLNSLASWSVSRDGSLPAQGSSKLPGAATRRRLASFGCNVLPRRNTYGTRCFGRLA